MNRFQAFKLAAIIRTALGRVQHDRGLAREEITVEDLVAVLHRIAADVEQLGELEEA